MLKALILTGQNQYSVVSYFLNGIADDLKLLGYDVDFLNVENQTNIDKGLPHICALEQYAFIISFNGVGLGKLSDTHDTLAYAKTNPLYVFCVDNPLHLILRFFGHPVTVLCVAQEHVEFMRACGIKAHYFPHAISHNDPAFSSNEDASSEKQYGLEKPNSILFPVSFNDKQAAFNELAPVWKSLGTAIDACANVTDFLQRIGVLPTANSPARTTLNESILRISAVVDRYLRAKEREACLLDFAKREIKLTVVGNNVERYRNVCDFHEYEQSVSFDALRDKFKQYEFVLHQSPGFERGLHERVIHAIAAGTGVITWNAPFALSAFNDAGAFAHNAPLPNATDALYTNALEVGKKQLLANHTWKAQLAYVLKAQNTGG